MYQDARHVLRYAREGENPLQEAVKDIDMFLIEKILEHRIEKVSRRKKQILPEDIQVKVMWIGSTPSWECLSNISVRKSEAFVRYASDIEELRRFIITSI